MSIFSFVAAFCLLQVIAGGKLDLKCKCDGAYAYTNVIAQLHNIGTACIDGECGMNRTKHAAGIQACIAKGETVVECENQWEPMCTSAKQKENVYGPCPTEVDRLCSTGEQQTYEMQSCEIKMGRIPVNTGQKCFSARRRDMFYCTTDNCNIPYDEACPNDTDTKK